MPRREGLVFGVSFLNEGRWRKLFCLNPGDTKNGNNCEGIWRRIKMTDSKTMHLRVMETFICPQCTSCGSVTREMWWKRCNG